MSILTHFRDKCAEALIPMQVTVELTYRCNERCGHCYLATYDDKADGRPPLALAEWKRVFGELAQAGTLLLVFIGGEAMLHPDFWELAAQASRLNFASSLITNGLLIDERAADRLAELGFYNVSVSLYSLDPAIHDAMTMRKGSHARTLAAIERLMQRRVPVAVNCLLTSRNIEGYFELEDWARAHELRISPDPLVTAKSDASLDSTVTRATPEQLLAYYRRHKTRGAIPVPQTAPAAADPACNAGRGKAAISVHGDLLTCLEVRDAIGNLRDHSFSELWASEKAGVLRGYRTGDLEFETGCGDGAFCDHCPGMARAETGNPMKPVPFLMDLARIKRQVFEEA